MRRWLECAVVGLTLATLGAPVACSSESSEDGEGASVSSNQPDGDSAGGNGSTAATSSGGSATNSNQASSMSEDDGLGFTDIAMTEVDAGVGMLGNGESCAGEARAAESIDLDIHLMVDISGSMTDVLPGTGNTKWDAVNAALQEFVQSPETADIGIGISYFPLLKDDVPETCTENDECGDAAPCTNSQCVIPVDFDDGSTAWIQSLDDQPVICADDAGCQVDGVLCRNVQGYCIAQPDPSSNDPGGVLAEELDDGTVVGFPCQRDADCPPENPGILPFRCDRIGLCTDALANGEIVSCTETLVCDDGGPCEPIPDVCIDWAICDANAYIPPAVPISSAADRSAAIIDSLESQELTSNTPTAPALEGALQHARDWAEENPSHQVVTVLATDGFPTTCDPLEIEGIAQLASDAARGDPSIKTFVIGVFGQLDLGADGEQRLDTLAVAGGTQDAFIVNTGGDVTQEFLDALNLIRDTSISCEFQLPDMDNLDFGRVNLNVTDDEGNESQLINVGDESGCADDNDGWFYVMDSDGTPVEINVCPNICDTFTSGGVSAELEIGCETQTLLR